MAPVNPAKSDSNLEEVAHHIFGEKNHASTLGKDPLGVTAGYSGFRVSESWGSHFQWARDANDPETESFLVHKGDRWLQRFVFMERLVEL